MEIEIGSQKIENFHLGNQNLKKNIKESPVTLLFFVVAGCADSMKTFFTVGTLVFVHECSNI
jgi:hypothetical protein